MSTGAQQFVLSSADRARLIAVDFTALDATGQVIRDLRPQDVSVRVDGRERPVRALEFVPAVAVDGGALLVPYGSNLTPPPGRTLLLIIDFESLRAGREAPLREHVTALLRGLQPADRVALVTVPYGGVRVDLTTDHARVGRALAELGGQAVNETESEAACRTRTTLSSLRGVLDDLSGGEGPVTVVFFANRLSVPQGIVSIQSGAAIGRCLLRREDFEQVGHAAARARARFYVVQPDLGDASAGRAGLEHLTGVTGAPLWHLGALGDSALAGVTRESGAYYLAFVEPEPGDDPDTPRRLRVSVTRDEALVRARPYLAIARPAPRAAARPSVPLDLMRQARTFRDLPLRVSGFSARDATAGLVRVAVLFDSPDRSVAMTEAMVGLFDESGRLVASRTLTAAELQSPLVMTALAAPAGRYRLRVAAVEGSGRAGTADVQLEAGLAVAGPLRLSDLVVGLSRDGQFQPRLEFGREAVATVQLELYGGREGARVGVVVELARTLTGPAVLATPGVFTATEEADRFLVTAAVPIGALPPGDYVVRATVAAEGQPGGRVVRPLRKAVN